ncbi:MAG: fructose-bisphosphate aldolase class I [Pseudonocardiales bacterium]|nr:fructose-bisphosphate aldolase class I [Pseudonocardiales bacterium]MBV9030186.1 fructose-bisphosphate aldolase class I [Pseudonocardiales bacterium]MBW0009186.1 fructose-bisphosphate aldolase class I [Pseudonocardiales bacterium]
MIEALHETARAMVSRPRGILAADESIGTMSSRLEKAGVPVSAENRRAYRQMLLTTPDLHRGISGVILSDETFNQRLEDGQDFPLALHALNILPGIKVDTGAKDLAFSPGEKVTEGLDGLRERLKDYVSRGARFAKWRAVIAIGEGRPTERALRANAHALGRYAALCQESVVVPIVEPEVLMDGDHTIGRCAEVTRATLEHVLAELDEAGVDLAGTVLKPNMVVPGSASGRHASPEEVAEQTVATLRAVLPSSLAGVAFLSGGQSPEVATANLAAMQKYETPWPLTFSFGRALVDPALKAWHGDPALVAEGQRALADRVEPNSAAVA